MDFNGRRVSVRFQAEVGYKHEYCTLAVIRMGRNQSLYKVQIFFDDGVGPVNPRHAEQSIDKLLDFRDEDADRLVHLLQGIHQEHILPK